MLDVRPRLRLLTIIGMLGISAAAQAHEFWIEPETHRPAVGKVLRVSLLHGERFAGEVVARDESQISRFVILGGDQQGPIVGRSGGSASLARPVAAGTNILVYESAGKSIELPAEKFEAYLKEEGLSAIARQRAARGESGEPGREVYSRCAKAIVVAGDAAAARNAVTDRVVGLPLEILLKRVPEIPSGVLSADARLSAQALFRGRPLVGARVVAVCKDEPKHLLEAVTDGDGMVSFPIARGGRWMITTIHMIRAEEEAVPGHGSAPASQQPAGGASAEPASAAPGGDARPRSDWCSFWASSTFEITTAGDPGAPLPGADGEK